MGGACSLASAITCGHQPGLAGTPLHLQLAEGVHTIGEADGLLDGRLTVSSVLIVGPPPQSHDDGAAPTTALRAWLAPAEQPSSAAADPTGNATSSGAWFAGRRLQPGDGSGGSASSPLAAPRRVLQVAGDVPPITFESVGFYGGELIINSSVSDSPHAIAKSAFVGGGDGGAAEGSSAAVTWGTARCRAQAHPVSG